MPKVRLTQQFNREVELSDVEAEALIKLGIAELVEEKPVRATRTRVMKPEETNQQPPPPPAEQKQPETNQNPNPTTNKEQTEHEVIPPTEGDLGRGVFSDEHYSRRDMQPKE